MSSVRVQVIRERPRDRSVVENASGRIKVSLKSLSYLHIGSGGRIVLDVVESKLKEIARRSRDLREISKEIKFKESLQFSSTSRGLTVPGSTIKGNVRARLELSFRNVEGKVESCFQKARILSTEPAVGTQGWRHYRIWNEALREDRGPPCDYTLNESVCLICNLFGTAGLKGFIEFSDFLQHNVSTEILKLPHEMELVVAKPGSHFIGHVDFYNLKPEEVGLMFIGMGLKDSRIGRPVLLGRLKYRKKYDAIEFGKVRYEIDSFELFKYSKTLRIGDNEISGGKEISGDNINKIIKLLTDQALKTFPGLSIIDEVERIEKIE